MEVQVEVGTAETCAGVRGGFSGLSYGIITRASAYQSYAARSLIEAIRARHVPPRGGVALRGRA